MGASIIIGISWDQSVGTIMGVVRGGMLPTMETLGLQWDYNNGINSYQMLPVCYQCNGITFYWNHWNQWFLKPPRQLWNTTICWWANYLPTAQCLSIFFIARCEIARGYVWSGFAQKGWSINLENDCWSCHAIFSPNHGSRAVLWWPKWVAFNLSISKAMILRDVSGSIPRDASFHGKLNFAKGCNHPNTPKKSGKTCSRALILIKVLILRI